MISTMETIYDVFRLLVSRSRQTVADSEVDQAMAIIDQADTARRNATAPVTAKEPTDG
jgi:hypothetical protein